MPPQTAQSNPCLPRIRDRRHQANTVGSLPRENLYIRTMQRFVRCSIRTATHRMTGISSKMHLAAVAPHTGCDHISPFIDFCSPVSTYLHVHMHTSVHRTYAQLENNWPSLIESLVRPQNLRQTETTIAFDPKPPRTTRLISSLQIAILRIETPKVDVASMFVHTRGCGRAGG